MELIMSQKTKGVLCILSAAFFFALMNLFVKLSGNIPTLQKTFFRNIVALVFSFILIKKQHISFKSGNGNWGSVLARSLFGTIGLICNFYAIDRLNISDASMLNKLSPFLSARLCICCTCRYIIHIKTRRTGSYISSCTYRYTRRNGSRSCIYFRKKSHRKWRSRNTCSICFFHIFMYLGTAILYILLYAYGCNAGFIPFYGRTCCFFRTIFNHGCLLLRSGKRTVRI